MYIIASVQYRGLNIVVKEWGGPDHQITVAIYGPCADYGDYYWSPGWGCWQSVSAKTHSAFIPCQLPDGLVEAPAILMWLNSEFRNTMGLKQFLVVTLGPE